MYKMRTWSFQGMVEGKNFIVDMKESTAEMLEESREERESSTLNVASRVDLAMWMGKAREEDKREDQVEHMPEMEKVQ